MVFLERSNTNCNVTASPLMQAQESIVLIYKNHNKVIQRGQLSASGSEWP